METKEQEIQFHGLNKNGFEGWYIRITDKEVSLAVIIGIHKVDDVQSGFIQTLDTISHASQNITFDNNDIHISNDPFMVQMGSCIFKKSYLYLDLINVDIPIHLEVRFSSYSDLDRTLYAPTIMGPFAYIPQMECNHAVINLGSCVSGTVMIQKKVISIEGTVYMEKDRGTSFPDNYIWLQSNTCLDLSADFFLASASIPLTLAVFQGTIAVLHMHNKQYRFATYYGARIIHSYEKEGYRYLTISQYPYRMYLKIKYGTTFPLKAPITGAMCAHVNESLDAKITLHLYKHRRLLTKLHFINCGCEITNFIEL